ncbi:ATP-grasp domain-containing protein [Paraflavitalea speifideaquila]|uniref:ATP-grasp domain-containing protein n=1 Tax=Paraflavitalea speifideaquila TaxID=3076558 RepID=UPI0028EF986D|nr:ATP-grasp domain-containing protein [Paraflavitalea speifideiaquila]
METWTKSGGQVKRLGKYWIKDDALANQPIAIYGNQTFALVLAQIYEVELISPDDTLITRLDKEWTKRDITQKQIREMSESDFLIFIKPVIPKLFLADIFQTHADFLQATKGLEDTEEILVSGIVDNIQAEARGYIMNGMVKDIALYEGAADLIDASSFLSDFVNNNKEQLPPVVVVDLAFNASIGWFVLEFNACWGAGLNNCRAENVVDCIIGATINK